MLLLLLLMMLLVLLLLLLLLLIVATATAAAVAAAAGAAYANVWTSCSVAIFAHQAIKHLGVLAPQHLSSFRTFRSSLELSVHRHVESSDRYLCASGGHDPFG